MEETYKRGELNKKVRDIALKLAKETMKEMDLTRENDKQYYSKQYQLQYGFYHTIKKELKIKDE
jgi:hypothetical protein